MAKIEIGATVRHSVGKGAARQVRNNKNIPAVIYGAKQDPLAIELNGHDFGELIRQPGLRTKLFVIDAGGKKESAMLMDIQYHPVKDAPMHADFKRIDIAKPVTVDVPVALLNTEISKGLKKGGALNFAVRSILISAKVDDIPEKIELDIQNMDITDTIHGRDIALPHGVELGLRQADLAIVTITGKMKEEAEVKKDAGIAPAPGAAAAAAGAPAAGAKGAPAKAAPAKADEKKK